MRNLLAVLCAAGVALFAAGAAAQQSSDWNHPSTQQQQDITQTRDNVKSGLNNIGTQDEQMGQGMGSTPTVSGVADQINDTTKSLVDQGGQMLDNIPGR